MAASRKKESGQLSIMDQFDRMKEKHPDALLLFRTATPMRPTAKTRKNHLKYSVSRSQAGRLTTAVTSRWHPSHTKHSTLICLGL